MADKNKRNLSYLHKVERTKVENGKVTVSEELVSHGDNGIIVKYFHKENKNSKKILIIASNGEYTIKETDSKDGQKGDTKEEKVSKDKLLKFIKKEKLDFALEYIEQHGGKKASRKSSKKASKKSSKKQWGGNDDGLQLGGKKRSSKKASKRGSKSKKGSRK